MQVAFETEMKVAKAGSSVAPSRRLSAGSIRRGAFRRTKNLLRPFAGLARTFMFASLEDEVRHNRKRMDEIGAQIDEIRRYSEASVRRVAVATGNGNVLVRTQVGWVLCSAMDTRVLAFLLESGDLERGTRLLIQRLLGPGDAFVDVGANLGLHTLAAAQAMQGQGHIYAFEPFEPTAALLRESVAIGGFEDIVEIHVAAVSSHVGRQDLFLGRVSGHHSLFALATLERSEEAAVEVPLVTLDIALSQAPVINLVKIDAEGAELDVLEGADEIIERSPEIALIVEFGPAHLGRSGRTVDAWFGHFERLGLIFQEIEAETGRLRRRSIDDLQGVESSNLFFARPKARVWSKLAGK